MILSPIDRRKVTDFPTICEIRDVGVADLSFLSRRRIGELTGCHRPVVDQIRKCTDLSPIRSVTPREVHRPVADQTSALAPPLSFYIYICTCKSRVQIELIDILHDKVYRYSLNPIVYILSINTFVYILSFHPGVRSICGSVTQLSVTSYPPMSKPHTERQPLGPPRLKSTNLLKTIKDKLLRMFLNVYVVGKRPEPRGETLTCTQISDLYELFVDNLKRSLLLDPKNVNKLFYVGLGISHGLKACFHPHPHHNTKKEYTNLALLNVSEEKATSLLEEASKFLVKNGFALFTENAAVNIEQQLMSLIDSIASAPTLIKGSRPLFHTLFGL